MKKISEDKVLYYKRRQVAKKKKESIASSRIKHRKYMDRVVYRGNLKLIELKRKRDDFIDRHYSTKVFDQKEITIPVVGEFGIEESQLASSFFNYAEQFISKRPAKIVFDLSKCTRMWPSAITLICSYVQWVELVTRRAQSGPEIGQIDSYVASVNSYLLHCGFFDYVDCDRRNLPEEGLYKDCDVVKIQRETSKSNINKKKDEISSLLKLSSSYTNDEIELFGAVLTEVINNVTEHGISHKDKGWWLLAQHHPKHHIISLCVADNGIGIKNSLVTGPQGEYIKTKLADTKNCDSDYIDFAMDANVSGALDAATKKRGWVRRQFPRGAKRGHGLQTILEFCTMLGIQLTIISGNGYIMFSGVGKKIACESYAGKIFAGTMYHLSIPTSRVQ
ncbi:hypothetical protein [Desulfocurvibacter africanus]|uniref:hypothetical protein n=1 Tax=Desulfocurvibacter africanus TaxID=873 RepID=UPI0003F8E0C0|nr:hypothetical protein [Desulfocurvibacter africanus]